MASVEGVDAVPDVEALLACLTLAHRYEEFSHCRICGPPPGVGCTCAPREATPQAMSPLERFKRRRGQFEGAAVVELFSGGVPFRSLRLIRRSTFDFSEKPSIGADLVKWAARDRLSVLSPSVPKLVVPAGEEETLTATASAGGAYCCDTGGESFVLNAFSTPGIQTNDNALKRTSPPEDGDDLEGLPASHGSCLSNLDTELDLSRNNLPHRPASRLVARRPRGHPVTNPRQLSAISTEGHAYSPVRVQGSSHSVAGPRPHTAPPAVRAAPPNDTPPASSAKPVATGTHGSVTANMARALQIVKDYGGSSNITRIVPMSDVEIDKVFRRARNREAAAFGNLRRKIRLQGLRGNLEECEECLQALLVENRELGVPPAATGVAILQGITVERESRAEGGCGGGGGSGVIKKEDGRG